MVSAELSPEVCRDIDLWLTKYPRDQRQSAIIYALTRAQEANQGWLSPAVIEAVADYLEIPRISAFEVATFYSMFEHKPVGRHKISICTNISCMLNGSDNLLHHLKEKLQIDINQTTPDGRFTLKEVECLAACAGAPALQINRQMFENMTVAELDHCLARLE